MLIQHFKSLTELSLTALLPQVKNNREIGQLPIPQMLKEKLEEQLDWFKYFKGMFNHDFSEKADSFTHGEWVACYQFLCTLEKNMEEDVKKAPKILQVYLEQVLAKYNDQSDFKKMWEKREIPEADRLALIFLNKIPLATVNNNEETVLHYVAQKGYTAMIQLLHQRGAPIEAQDISGSTVLHIAATLVDPLLFQYLLGAGACLVKSKQGELPLHVAAAYNRPAIVKELLALNIDLESKNIHDETALHRAAVNSSVEVIKLLLDHNANIEALDKNGRTPLHQLANAAGTINNEEAVAQLLAGHANINAQDVKGSTPLHLAAQQGKQAVYEQLLAAGADANQVNNKGEKAADLLVVKSGRECSTRKIRQSC